MLQLPMIMLWRCMLKRMNTWIQDRLKAATMAETCFSVQRLPYGGACGKHEYIHPGPSTNYAFS